MYTLLYDMNASVCVCVSKASYNLLQPVIIKSVFSPLYTTNLYAVSVIQNDLLSLKKIINHTDMILFH